MSALTRFSRPHTVIATTIQVLALFLIAGGGQEWSRTQVGPLLLTWLSCLSLNLYVVGLNQITDVEIDQVNKPYLPLASTEWSARRGWILVTGFGVLALATAWLAGPFLSATVIVIGLVGTAYSLPPLRLKRFSLWAALSIALARGVVANVGVALHYNQVYGGLAGFSVPLLVALAAFFFGFGLVIAIYKDIPDLVGDRLHNIRTFTVTLGPRRAFDLGRLILTLGYLGLMGLAASRLPGVDGVLLLVTQGLLLALFWLASSRVDPQQQGAFVRFYMFLWALFYAQYAVLSLYALAGRVA